MWERRLFRNCCKSNWRNAVFKVQLQCTVDVNLILFTDSILGRQESRPHDGCMVEKKTWQFFVDDRLMLLL